MNVPTEHTDKLFEVRVLIRTNIDPGRAIEHAIDALNEDLPRDGEDELAVVDMTWTDVTPE